jgi:hypothetical protein
MRIVGAEQFNIGCDKGSETAAANPRPAAAGPRRQGLGLTLRAGPYSAAAQNEKSPSSNQDRTGAREARLSTTITDDQPDHHKAKDRESMHPTMATALE